MCKIQNVSKFFYSVNFTDSISATFCSFIKNLKSDENEFLNLALSLCKKIEPFKNDFDILVSVPKYKQTSSETDYSEKLACILSSKLDIPYKKYFS